MRHGAPRPTKHGRDGHATRLVVALALVLLTASMSHVDAHATVVVGTFSTVPDPPLAAEPTVLSIQLEYPTLTPVEDALVFVDLTPSLGGETERLRLDELSDAPGTYRAAWRAPAEGVFDVTVRDQTFRQEEALVGLSIRVGTAADSNGAIDFVLPPTATAPSSPATWLIFLIGLPLLVGVIVTVLVLRTGTKQADPGPPP